MSLDMERLKAKLAQLKDPKTGRQSERREKRLWSPDNKKVNTVRLMQNPHGEDPFVELHFHYGIGKGGGILCSRMNEGKTCQICEFGFSLFKDGDRETAKKMFPRQRIFAAMVDRSDPTLSPKWWGFGKEIYQQLIEALLNEEYGTFLDPVSGLDAEVKCEKRGDSQWLRPVLTFKRKESRLADPLKVPEILKAIPRLDEVFHQTSKTEIQERLNSWLSVGESDGGETERSSTGPSADSEPASDNLPSDAAHDLDAAFEKALQDS